MADNGVEVTAEWMAVSVVLAWGTVWVVKLASCTSLHLECAALVAWWVLITGFYAGA